MRTRRSAAVVLAVVLVLAAGWCLTRSEAVAPVVPYADPEPFHPAFQYVSVPPAAPDLVPCTGEQLVVGDVVSRIGPDVSANGGALYMFGFTNAGAACAMSGGPDMVVAPVGGGGEPFRPPASDTAEGPGRPTSLPPAAWRLAAGQDVYVDLAITGVHCAHFSAATLRVSFGGAWSGLPVIDVPAPDCPVAGTGGDRFDTSVWTPFHPHTTPVPLGELSDVDTRVFATIDVPATVTAGAPSIDYTVTLSNPTASDVALRPCPHYWESAGESATGASGYEPLNCADAPAAIPAGGSLTFAMSIPLDEGLGAGGMITVFWRIHPDDSPVGASQALAVVAA